MASRSISVWATHIFVSGWRRDNVTYLSNGNAIITAFVKEPTQIVNVDGEQKESGYVYVFSQPDLLQPDTNPFVTRTVDNISTGGDYTPPDTYIGDIDNPMMRNNLWYVTIAVTGSTVCGVWDSCDYTFDTAAELWEKVDAGELVPISLLDNAVCDIYIKGNIKPSIFARWHLESTDTASPLTMQARFCYSVTDLQDIKTNETYNIPEPDTSKWYVNYPTYYFDYDSKWDTTYLSLAGTFDQYLNPVSRVEYFGVDGTPDNIDLLFRFVNSDDKIGSLYRISIPISPSSASDITVQLIEQSSYNPNFNTQVVIHYDAEPTDIISPDDSGYPSGSDIDGGDDGKYGTDPDIEAFDDADGIGFDGNAVLTKSYAVTAATLRNIGEKLWTQDYFNVLKIQNNPIENIIAVKAYPFDNAGASTENVKVGDIDFGVSGDIVPSVVKFSIASGSYSGRIKYTGKYGNYLDLAPFTKIKVNLPYVGLIDIDPADIFNATLKVEYVVDLVTGQCMAKLTVDGIPYMNCYGNMGVDVPLTSSNRVQTELKQASAMVSAYGGAAGQLMSGDVAGAGINAAASTLSFMGADYATQRTASLSPACDTFANHAVFLLIEYPLFTGESAGYKHLHGYPCHKYMPLSSFSGFVQVDKRADIQIAMTSEENAILENLLTTGVYI